MSSAPAGNASLRPLDGRSAVRAPLRIAVTQLGARQAYVVPKVLEEAGLLERLYTDLCAQVWPWPLLEKLLPQRLRPDALRRLLARRAAGVPVEKIRCFPGYALRTGCGARRADTPAKQMRFWQHADEQFGRLVVGCGLGDANAVYAYNLAALEILEYAKSRGMATILEQISLPLAPEAALLEEEARRWPDWVTERTAACDWQARAVRERQEWQRADLILCGSEWVRRGLAGEGGPVERAQVVPYCAGASFYRSGPKVRVRRKLRVLFAGSLILRKGIPYVMQAAQRLAGRDVVIRLAGKPGISAHGVRQLGQWTEVLGPVARDAMARQYEWADVFLLPSISEGSAVVCYEALAAGLPVIATPNAGSVVRDGVDGMLVPMRDPEAIAEGILRLAEDRDLLEQMSQNALAGAREFTAERYQDRLLGAIRQRFCDA